MAAGPGSILVNGTRDSKPARVSAPPWAAFLPGPIRGFGVHPGVAPASVGQEPDHLRAVGNFP